MEAVAPLPVYFKTIRKDGLVAVEFETVGDPHAGTREDTASTRHPTFTYSLSDARTARHSKGANFIVESVFIPDGVRP